MKALYRPLALSLVLVGAIGLSACDSTSGTVATGTIENSFGAPVQEATVEFTPQDLVPEGTSPSLRGGIQCITDEDGDFECDDLSDGTYTVTVSATGYASQTESVEISGDTEVDIPALAGLGTFDDALLRDASTLNPIGNAAMHCHRELPSGGFSTNAEFNTTSSAAGLVNAGNVFTGQAQCFIDAGASNFVAYPNIIDVHTQPIEALPGLESGEYRVVLTWGVTPSDLDSHLTGPDGSGGRFHVYYADRDFAGHNLDLDDVSSFGPETVTIRPDGVDGMYRYSVFNFSDQSDNGAVGIAQSPTRVRVFDANGPIRTFVAPGATDGNTWRVFEMTVNGSSVSFNPNSSQNGLGYFTAEDSGDTEIFLTGGGSSIVTKAQI
jgi:hypothetical protein